MRRGKLFINKKPPKAKVGKEVELVSHCETCGRRLGRTSARRTGSLVCAIGDGIAARHLDCVRFFCCPVCADSYEGSR